VDDSPLNYTVMIEKCSMYEYINYFSDIVVISGRLIRDRRLKDSGSESYLAVL